MMMQPFLDSSRTVTFPPGGRGHVTSTATPAAAAAFHGGSASSILGLLLRPPGGEAEAAVEEEAEAPGKSSITKAMVYHQPPPGFGSFPVHCPKKRARWHDYEHELSYRLIK